MCAASAYTHASFSRGRTGTVLNRIYIVVGLFAIVVLAGAFLAPRFIQWGDYRDRMEVLATSVLGAEVSIRGDISFSDRKSVV